MLPVPQQPAASPDRLEDPSLTEHVDVALVGARDRTGGEAWASIWAPSTRSHGTGCPGACIRGMQPDGGVGGVSVWEVLRGSSAAVKV